MASLISIVRNKFLEAIRSVNPQGKWKILVVDEFSQKILGFVLKQFDVLQENVTLIELLNNHREPQPGFEALYLLMPTTQNIERVIGDFSNGRQQYMAAHLFFIEGLDEPLFQRLTSSPAEPFLKALKELFINFWPTEAKSFSLQDPALFFSLYAPPKVESTFRPCRIRLEEDLLFMSKTLANVCITLNEFPFIRYYFPPNHPPLGALKPHASTRPPPPPSENNARWRTNLARGSDARAYESVESDHATRVLAVMVQRHLEEHKRANPDFGKPTSHIPDQARARGILIITDRSMDLLAPFVHEFTYQAMVNDLLPIENSKYTYKFQSSLGTFEDKTATLSDQDTVWTDIRHIHMREAIDKLMLDFNKFLEENAVFKGEGAASLNDMKEMLATLPQYQEQREKFSLHLNMAQECMAIFERDKLSSVANVEQNCATGLTAEGKSPKHLVEEMVPLLDSRDVINANKVRIIALYIQYRDGVPEEDRRRLYQHARLSLAEQDAVNALVHLGTRINRTPSDKDSKKKLKQRSTNEEEYELSRYSPLLRVVIEDHINGKLDSALFPYAKEAPSAAPSPTLRSPPAQTTSLRSQKPSWHRAAKSSTAVSDNKQRIIVFVAGGMTFSEIRECYELSTAQNKDIFIGSTHTITPRSFVDDLKVLEIGGVGSKALPNGVREDNRARSFQEYYDARYYTKDTPPAKPSLAIPKDKRSGKISPANSFSSTISGATSPSSTAPPPLAKDEKKKKKGGLFRF